MGEELELITIKEFLENQSKYKHYYIYIHTAAKDKKSSSGKSISIEQLKKRNPNEIGWLDCYWEDDGVDDDYGRIRYKVYSFNLGFNLTLKRNINTIRR